MDLEIIVRNNNTIVSFRKIATFWDFVDFSTELLEMLYGNWNAIVHHLFVTASKGLQNVVRWMFWSFANGIEMHLIIRKEVHLCLNGQELVWTFELNCIGYLGISNYLKSTLPMGWMYSILVPFETNTKLNRINPIRSEPSRIELSQSCDILWCLTVHHKSNSVSQINSISISQSFKRYLSCHCLKYYLLNVAAFCLQYFIGFSFIVLPLVTQTHTHTHAHIANILIKWIHHCVRLEKLAHSLSELTLHLHRNFACCRLCIYFAR